MCAVAPSRPRIEGEREAEILAAALEVLTDTGYDLFTFDAVSKRARVSKASLYRRWASKVDLVIAALLANRVAPTPTLPDTGSLREDLIAVVCGDSGLEAPKTSAQFAAVLTALMRDGEFADAFRTKFIGPKLELSRQAWQRAADRGELRDDVDLDLLTPASAGIVLHRMFLLGEEPSRDLITRVIDQIILPAALKPELLARATPSAKTKE